jgi:uncharacterized protein with HEPN domain
MSRHDPKVTLRQIIESAERAQELCRGRTTQELSANWQVAMAFERAMEIMGEAVKRLPEDLRARHPAVPWRQIAGMRDRLSHGYDSVDYELLCNAVRDDVPQLLETVRGILRELEASQAMSVRSETHQWSADAHVRVGSCRRLPVAAGCVQHCGAAAGSRWHGMRSARRAASPAAPLISTGLQPGGSACGRESRFNGFPSTESAPRPVKTVETVLTSTLAYTRLKPGANERGRCAVGSVPAFLLS